MMMYEAEIVPKINEFMAHEQDRKKQQHKR
jgi:hypothetical protein